MEFNCRRCDPTGKGMSMTPFAKALSTFEPEEPQGEYTFDDLADPLQHALAWELLRSCNRHLGFKLRQVKVGRSKKMLKLSRGAGADRWNPSDGVPPPKLRGSGGNDDGWTIPTMGLLSFTVECEASISEKKSLVPSTESFDAIRTTLSEQASDPLLSLCPLYLICSLCSPSHRAG